MALSEKSPLANKIKYYGVEPIRIRNFQNFARHFLQKSSINYFNLTSSVKLRCAGLQRRLQLRRNGYNVEKHHE